MIRIRIKIRSFWDGIRIRVRVIGIVTGDAESAVMVGMNVDSLSWGL
jgi:hypothetical protein